MLPYQNYFQQQTYPNSYSQIYQQYQQYQQPQNNYLQQAQMQSTNLYNNMNQQQNIVGRVVNDFSEIVANDVPMDGRSAIFLKGDMSEIQARAWGADGKIQMTSYKPILAQNQQDTNNLSQNNQNFKIELSDDATQTFMQRFDDISNRLDLLEQFLNKSARTPTKAKKESESV